MVFSHFNRLDLELMFCEDPTLNILLHRDQFYDPYNQPYNVNLSIMLMSSKWKDLFQMLSVL